MKSVMKKIGLIAALLLVVAYIVAIIVVSIKGIAVPFFAYLPFIGIGLIFVLLIVLIVVLKSKGEIVSETLKDVFWR